MLTYYNIDEVVAKVPNATIYNTVGQRGTGKSFSSLRRCTREAVLNGRLFCFVGRRKEDIKPSLINEAFTDIIVKGVVNDIMKKSTYTKYNKYNIKAERKQINLYGIADGDTQEKICQIGIYTAVFEAERFKRGTYPNVYNIFFDEFITAKGYINGDREPQEFEKIVHTIARGTKDVKVFLCGNPDNEIELCPYMTHYNIIYDELEPSTVYEYNNGNYVFVKLANSETQYINEKTKSLFGIENKTSFSGSVDRPKTARAPEGFFEEYRPFYQMQMETPIIKMAYNNVEYRQCIYGYVGVYKGELFAYISAHTRFKKVLYHSYHYYNDNVLPRKNCFVMYRMYFGGVVSRLGTALSECIQTGRIYFDSDKTANIFRNLRGK